MLSDESAGWVAELDPAGVSGEPVRGTMLIDTNWISGLNFFVSVDPYFLLYFDVKVTLKVLLLVCGFFFSFLSCTFANIKSEVKCIFPASSSLLLPPKEMKWIFCASYSISEERNLLSDNGYLKIWCFCLCRLEPRKKPGRTIIQPAHGDQGWAMHAVPDQ